MVMTQFLRTMFASTFSIIVLALSIGELSAQTRLLHSVDGGDEAFVDFAFDAKGKRLVTVGDDGTKGQTLLKWWDVETGKLVDSRTLPIGQPNTKRGEVLVSSDLVVVNGPRFVIYDIANDSLIIESELPVSTPVMSSDGKKVVWTSFDEKEFKRNEKRARKRKLDPVLFAYEHGTGTVLNSGQLSIGKIADAALSRDGQILATYSQDKVLRVWDATQLVELAKLTDNDSGSEVKTNLSNRLPNEASIAITPTGNHVITRFDKVKLWDVQAGTSLDLQFPLPFQLSADGTTLFRIIETQNGLVMAVQDIATKKVSAQWDMTGWSLPRLRLTPDGKKLVGVTDRVEHPTESSSEFRVWNVGTGQLEADLTGKWHTTIQTKISSNGKYAVSSHAKVVNNELVSTLNIWQLSK